MTILIAAAAYFLLVHILVSGTRLRGAIVGRIGQGPYLGLFSLASIAGLIWLGVAYSGARDDPSNVVWWDIQPATAVIQPLLQLLAFLLIVIGIATPNPTSVRQEGALDRPDVVGGILRVTRHPFLWGVALWAFGHLMVNGAAADLILFGSLLLLAVLGTATIDAKRRRALGDSWEAFAAQTSNLPFAAIVAGRQSFQLREIGWWRIGLAIVVWAALAAFHPALFGVTALSL